MKLLFFSLFLSLNISAQNADIEKLLKNKDITWVAEVTDTLLLDNELSELLSLRPSVVLKILNDDKNNIAPDNGNDLTSILFNAPDKNFSELYSDEDLKIKITKDKAFYRTDTLDLESDTYERKFKIIHSMLIPEDIYAYKFRYNLIYNAVQAKFDIEPISIAPLHIIFDEAGNTVPNIIRPENWKRKLEDTKWNSTIAYNNLVDSIVKMISYLEPLCYIKLKSEKKLPELASNDITWAMRFKELRQKGRFEENFKILKSTKGSVIKQVLEKVNTDKKIQIISTDSWNLIDAKLRFEIFNRIDTVETIDPNTNERKIKVVTAGLNYDGCKRLRLAYDWFWDRKKNQLIVKLLGVAPSCDVNDEAGNFMYLKTMFYLPAPGR